jgi:hypothetical protein
MGNPNLMGWMGLTQSSWTRSNVEKKQQLKIGRSFEKRTYSIYFKMIRSTYAGILNLMNGGDAHTQYGSIVNLLTLAHINNQGCWSKYIVR